MDIVTGPIHLTTALAAEHRRELDLEIAPYRAAQHADAAERRRSDDRPTFGRSLVARATKLLSQVRRGLGDLVSEIRPWPGSLGRPPIVVAAEKRRRRTWLERTARRRSARSKRATA